MNRRQPRFILLASLEFFGAGWEIGHGEVFAAVGLTVAGIVFAWLSWGPRYY